MGSIAFDKLKYLETLKASGISEAQARAHTEALAQAFAETPDLATKSDLRAESRLESRVREAELRLEAKIEASRTEIIKWFVTSLFAQAAVIVALLKLLP
ncbi:MAG: hypothetical protein ACXW3P_08555 [Rhodospirillales bacterium]